MPSIHHLSCHYHVMQGVTIVICKPSTCPFPYIKHSLHKGPEVFKALCIPWLWNQSSRVQEEVVVESLIIAGCSKWFAHLSHFCRQVRDW